MSHNGTSRGPSFSNESSSHSSVFVAANSHKDIDIKLDNVTKQLSNLSAALLSSRFGPSSRNEGQGRGRGGGRRSWGGGRKKILLELWGRSLHLTVHSNSIEGKWKGRYSCRIWWRECILLTHSWSYPISLCFFTWRCAFSGWRIWCLQWHQGSWSTTSCCLYFLNVRWLLLQRWRELSGLILSLVCTMWF